MSSLSRASVMRPLRMLGPTAEALGSRVSVWTTVSLSGYCAASWLRWLAVDHVAPGLVAVDENVLELGPLGEAVLDDAVVGHDAGAGADVIDRVGLGFDIGRQGVGAGEAGDRQAAAFLQAADEEGREERRVFRLAADVAFFLDGDGQVFFVGRGGERVGSRRLFFAFDVFEEGGEPLQLGKVVRDRA